MKNLLCAALLCLSCGLGEIAAADDKTLPPRLSKWVDAYEHFELDRFLGFYADDVVFRDPTAQINFESKDQLKSAYARIMQGGWGGNYRFDIKNIIVDGATTVFEGLFSLTFNGEKAEIHFTTWLEYEDGKIKRQLDMFDYNELQRQLPDFGKSLPSEYTGPRD